MKGKKFLVTAMACAALMLGFGGTTSAAEIKNDISTLQVESQELSRHLGRNYPPPRHRQPVHREIHREYHQTGWANSGRRSGGSVTTVRRSTTRVVIKGRV